MEQERRRVPRFRLIAPAEIIDEASGTRITAYVTGLSLYGCTLGVTHPPRPGKTILLQIVTPDESFESRATVVYSDAHSVGVTLWDVKPHSLTVLHRLLATAMPGPQGTGGSSGPQLS
jgi:PilZ domain